MTHAKYSILLTMLMSLMGMEAAAHDIEVPNSDGVTIYYTWANNNTELSVSRRGSSYGSYSGNVVIPEAVTYNGNTYSVTSIGSYAFRECSRLTSVTIPNSVTSIGSYAFKSCGLNNINIPNGVTSIGGDAFALCGNLVSVTIPNSMTSIGAEAFAGCTHLTKVNITNITTWCNIHFGGRLANPLAIAHHLYLNEEEVKELVIPNSVTSINGYAFQGCTGLISVTIPNSVSSIGGYAFDQCSYLKSVEFHCNKINSWFEGLHIKEVTIGDEVTSIGDNAFNGCSGLTNVTIPNSVTSIGSYAFYGCI